MQEVWKFNYRLHKVDLWDYSKMSPRRCVRVARIVGNEKFSQREEKLAINGRPLHVGLGDHVRADRDINSEWGLF